MNHRIICRYLPDAAVCQVARKPGAWRIVECWETPHPKPYSPIVMTFKVHPDGTRLLSLYSHRPRQANTWVKPIKVLREWLAYRRENGLEWEEVQPSPHLATPCYIPFPQMCDDRLGRGG